MLSLAVSAEKNSEHPLGEAIVKYGEKNNIEFKKGVWFEDVEFIYRLFPFINSIGVVEEPLYNFLSFLPTSINNVLVYGLYMVIKKNVKFQIVL